MRTILRLIALSTVPLFGCGVLPPAAPPAPPFDTAMSVKQLMEWVVDPAVDVIWDSVATIYTEAGTKEVAPHTDEQWAAVRNSAATVAESGNLLMMDGGEPTLWLMEMTSPGNLVRAGGWTRTSVKPGDKVTVDFSPLRDGKKGGALKKITLVDTGQFLTADIRAQERANLEEQPAGGK